MNIYTKLLLVLCVLTGCSYGQLAKNTGVGAQRSVSVPKVYETNGDYEYILEAKGDWCPWQKGIKSCAHVFSAGEYRVKDTDGPYLIVTLDRAGILAPRVTKYEKQKDQCRALATNKYTCSPNYYVETLGQPNDTYIQELWGLRRLNLQSVWSSQVWDVISRNAKTIPIAVVDTGVMVDHIDLKNQIYKTYNAITGDEDQIDDNGHGTHVAGTICASGNNGFGITGVTWGCKLMPVKFLGANGGGSVYNAIKGINWAVKNGAKIINNSWGGGGYSEPLENAIKRAEQKGVLFIAAAGNSANNNDKNPSYPANYNVSNVISVAALTENGTLAGFSNFGKKTVDIAAPGVNVFSTYNTGGYASLSGTSMATPHISGLAAITWARYPRSSYKSIKRRLYSYSTQNDMLRHRVRHYREANSSFLNKYFRNKDRSNYLDNVYKVCYDGL